MVSSSDIATKVRHRVAGIPSAITNAIIEEYVTDSIIELTNITGDSVSASSIDTKYQSLLTYMGAIKVIEYMLQPSFSLGGELSINRSDMLALKRDMEKKLEIDIARVRSTGGVQTTEPRINLP
jgi:hypothetical protein